MMILTVMMTMMMTMIRMVIYHNNDSYNYRDQDNKDKTEMLLPHKSILPDFPPFAESEILEHTKYNLHRYKFLS